MAVTTLSQPAKIYPRTGGKSAGNYKSIDIEVADNGGFMVRCREREKPSANDAPSPYVEPKTEVVSSVKELMTLLKGKLGGKAEETEE